MKGRFQSELTRIFHESLAATTDMAVLPGVLRCWILRRTVQVRLGPDTLRLPGGTPILFALAALRSVPHRKRHLRQAGSQFRGLATAIHEISGLNSARSYKNARVVPGNRMCETL
ncbi:MAG: hypothetical protein LJE87_13460 [Deltaproteobacteria bacterium]|nr:hypothetical protein [Deltaproteobacteria bacterium]